MSSGGQHVVSGAFKRMWSAAEAGAGEGRPGPGHEEAGEQVLALVALLVTRDLAAVGERLRATTRLECQVAATSRAPLHARRGAARRGAALRGGGAGFSGGAGEVGRHGERGQQRRARPPARRPRPRLPRAPARLERPSRGAARARARARARAALRRGWRQCVAALLRENRLGVSADEHARLARWLLEAVRAAEAPAELAALVLQAAAIPTVTRPPGARALAPIPTAELVALIAPARARGGERGGRGGRYGPPALLAALYLLARYAAAAQARAEQSARRRTLRRGAEDAGGAGAGGMSEAEEATVRMLPLRLLLRDAEAAGAEAVFAPLLRLVVALFPAAPPARLVASPALGAAEALLPGCVRAPRGRR